MTDLTFTYALASGVETTKCAETGTSYPGTLAGQASLSLSFNVYV